jgi:hypothetical protein
LYAQRRLLFRCWKIWKRFGSVLEDEYLQTTIWRKIVPSKEKPIYITTKIEKLANEEMVIMYEFMKEHFQGRIYRKPRDLEEFMGNIMIYFEKGQTRRYNQNLEDRLYKTLVRLDPDQEWMRWTTKKRIKELQRQGVELEVNRQKSQKEIDRQKEKDMEAEIKKHTKNMSPIQVWKYKDEFLKNVQKGKETPDLSNALTEKLLEVHLKDTDESIDSRTTLEWRKFRKVGKKKGIYEMKRLVNKWLGREKSDIREKIELQKEWITKKLQKHQKLLSKFRDIYAKNGKDAKFLPLLEEAKEKNRILRIADYNNHINKILEGRLNNYWKKIIKESKEDRRRIIQLIREANIEREEIIKEQNDFQEVMGLYGQEAYLQKGKA